MYKKLGSLCLCGLLWVLCLGCPMRPVTQPTETPTAESSTSDGTKTERASETDGPARDAQEPAPVNDERGRDEATPPREPMPDAASSTERTAPPEIPAEGSAPDTNAGLWGAFQVIDVHAHIGSYRGFDLSTPTLLDNIRRYGVRMALISNIDGAKLPGVTKDLDEVKANQATVDTVKQHPSLLRGIAWTRPNDGSPAKIEPFLRDAKLPNQQRIFVGMKFHPEMNSFPADSKLLDGYLRLCEKYKVVAVFHTGGTGANSDPQKIYTLAKRFPKVSFILYHMGFSGNHKPAISIVKESIQKGDAKLYLGTAQAQVEGVLQAIKDVSSTHVLFGSDATYYGKDHYGQYKTMVSRLQQALSPKEFANVMHNNAKTLFGLP